MKPFTSEQVTNYLEKPDECPYCGSQDIFAFEPEYSNNEYWQQVKCKKCGEQWVESYQLTNIEPVED